jgi:hypothetical protein
MLLLLRCMNIEAYSYSEKPVSQCIAPYDGTAFPGVPDIFAKNSNDLPYMQRSAGKQADTRIRKIANRPLRQMGFIFIARTPAVIIKGRHGHRHSFVLPQCRRYRARHENSPSGMSSRLILRLHSHLVSVRSVAFNAFSRLEVIFLALISPLS